jgi:ribose transport system substrate-binding protein
MARVATLSFVCVTLLAAISCKRHEEATGGSGAARRLQVAVIPKGTTHEFWKSVHAGAVKASRELGVDLVWKGPVREDDRAEQVRVVEDFVSKHVDGIVLAPLDDAALVPPVKEAESEKIPVVIIDSDINWTGRVSFVATDNEQAGAAAARHLGKLLGGKGRVLVLRYQEGSASTMQREKGFLETLAKEFPDAHVVSDNQYGGATTESAYKTAESLLVKLDELDGVFCPNESTTFGMLRALEDAKRAGKLRFVGFDASEKLVRALGNGEIDGLVVQDPFAMGERSVGALVSHLGGKAVDARVDTGVVIATKESMADPKIRARLTPDLAQWLN